MSPGRLSNGKELLPKLLADGLAKLQRVFLYIPVGNGKQQEQISRHLRHHLGKEFLPTKNSISMLCDGHATIYVDHVKHQYKDSRESEKVEYSIKAFEEELCLQLSRLLKARKH